MLRHRRAGRLICTAQFPAPVGSATVESIWVVSNAVNAALNKLLAASDRYRARAQAVNDGTMATFNLRRNEPIRRGIRSSPDGSFGWRVSGICE